MRGIRRQSSILGVGATMILVAVVLATTTSGTVFARTTAGGPEITSGSYDPATQELTVNVTLPPDGGVDTLTLYDAPCDGASCSFGGYQGVTYWPLDDHLATSITVTVDPSPTGTWYALVHGYCTACDTPYSNTFAIPASGTAPPPTTTTEPAPTTTTEPVTTTTTTPKPPVTTPVPSPNRPAIGTVSGMQGVVEIQSSGGHWIKVPANFTFHTNDHLRTGSNGRLMLALADGTYFTLGPGSDLWLDDFVYEPNRRDTIAARISLGIFRWVTGKVCHKPCAGGEKVTMPVGTIGIRGTDFVLRAAASANTATVDLHEGAATVHAFGGKTATITGPRRATITKSGAIRVAPLTAAGWKADLAALRH